MTTSATVQVRLRRSLVVVVSLVSSSVICFRALAFQQNPVLFQPYGVGRRRRDSLSLLQDRLAYYPPSLKRGQQHQGRQCSRRYRGISVLFNAATPPTPQPSSTTPTSSSPNHFSRFQQHPTPLHDASSSPSMSPSPSWNEIFDTSVVPTSNMATHDDLTVIDRVLLAGCSALALSAFLLLAFFSAPGSWRYFLAGGVCAATSHAIPTPIDVIKTRKQVDPRLADTTTLEAGRIIVKEEGFNALWAGLGPTAWGYLMEGAVKFGVYEIAKPTMRSWLARMASLTSLDVFRSQVLSFALCGTVAGLAASFLLCPMEALRIRMVAEPSFAPKGWIQGGARILKNEGVQGLAKGMNPMIMKQVPYTVTKNVSFDLITKFLYSTIRATGVSISMPVSIIVPLLAAASASVLSTLSSQPGDMILSLVNAHKGNQMPLDFVKSIMRSERGIRGFFVGFRTRLLLSGLTVTIQLLVYDMVKRICGVAATGSL